MIKDLNKFLSYTKPVNDCLVWTRCLNTDGYPRAVVDGCNNTKVHRVVYELYNNVDATGKVIRHTCDNPQCINPKHLLIGTHKDNMQDRELRGRHGKAKITHKEVLAIRELAKLNKFTQVELGSMFNLNPRTISSLVLGRHWRHVA